MRTENHIGLRLATHLAKQVLLKVAHDAVGLVALLALRERQIQLPGTIGSRAYHGDEGAQAGAALFALLAQRSSGGLQLGGQCLLLCLPLCAIHEKSQ